MAVQVIRFRRARALACYWRQGQLIAHNYATGVRAAAPSLAIEVLDFCEEWRTLDDVFAGFSSYPRVPFRRLLSLLARHTLLERTVGTPTNFDGPLDTWRTWMPEAAIFHFSTKDVRYKDEQDVEAHLMQKAEREPPPAPTKSYPDALHTPLPDAINSSPLAHILRARRTWRKFGDRAWLELTEIATLLGLTWGVQQWAHTELGRSALKTSPSGGARHPIEAYLLARRVKGLAAGLYHYDCDAHQLALLKRGLSASRLERYLPQQSCYRDVPAIVIMTAIFAREQWRYEFPRAYRVVLLDAGHLCQTFCLVATALGLAPFCTAALADSLIERHLGIDGVTESVIYACGVGSRPPGVEWAPWPETTGVPTLFQPKSASNSPLTKR